MNYLDQFFQCYFNQDWVVLYGTSANAVQTFIDESSYVHIQAVKIRLSDLLSKVLTEAELENVLVNEYDCSYNPVRTGETYLTWLRSIVDQITTHLDTMKS